MNKNTLIKIAKENAFQHFTGLNARTIERCSKQLKSKKQYNILSVVFDAVNKNGKKMGYKLTEKTIITFGNNNIAKNSKATTQEVTTYVAGSNIKKTVKNYINNIVLGVIDREIIDLIKDSYGKTIFIPARKDDIIIQIQENQYFSIVKNKVVEFRSGWNEYYTAVYTTTSMKKKGVYFIKKDKTHYSWRDTIEELIPDFYKELTSKAIKNSGKVSREVTRAGAVMYQIDALKAIKIFGRPSLAMTSCVRLGELKGIAIYKGTFIPEVNGTSASDGSAFFCNEAMAEFMNITPNEAQKLCLQLRSRNARDKHAATGASKEWIDSKVVEFKAKGLVRIIGDENNVGILIDDNCVKLNGKDSLDTDLRLYNIAEPGFGESSIQALTKPAFAASQAGKLDEFCNYIIETAKEQLMAEVEKKLEDTTTDAKLGSTYYADVIKQFNAINPIVKNAKKTEIQNSAMKRIQKVKFDFGFRFGALVPDRAAMITDGKFELLQHTDTLIEVFFGEYSIKLGNAKRKMEYLKNKLHYAVFNKTGEEAAIRDEIDSVSMQIKDMSDNSEAVLYKYPSASHIEYLKVKVVDSFELENRIKNFTNINDIDRKEILNGIKYASYGIIMMPNDISCMSLLAGFDFDFDEAFICFDKKLNGFLPFNRQTITLNKNIDSGENMLPVDDNLINEVVSMQLALDDNVGKVTVEFTVVTMLLIDMLDGRDEAYKFALYFLDEAFGKKHHNVKKDYYESPKDRVISPAFIDAIITEIMQVEWSKQNIMKFLLDCCFVGRFYQESIIDATKTGEFFNRLISCTSIKLMSRQGFKFVDGKLQRVHCDKLGNYKKIKQTVKRGKEIVTTNVTDREVPYVEYNDVFGRIQDKLIAIFNNKIVPMMEKKFESYGYTKDDVAKMHQVFLLVKDGKCMKKDEGKKVFAESFDKLMEAKTVYGVLIHNKMEMLEKAGDDEDSIKTINDDFDLYVKALAKNVKDIFDNMSKYANFSSYMRGALLLAISIYDKNKNSFDSTSENRFAYLMDMKSTIAFITKSENDVYRTYGEILYDEGKASVGDTITLERGMDFHNGIICESTYSGEATYAIDDNGAYLIQERNISDLIKDDEDLNSNLLTLSVYDFLSNGSNIEEVFDYIDEENSKVLLINNSGKFVLRVYDAENNSKDIYMKKFLGINNDLMYKIGTKVSENIHQVIGKKRILYNENDKEIVKYYSLKITR